MTGRRVVEERSPLGEHLRMQLLAGTPLEHRRLQVAGVSTALLEGGEGDTVILLHGQGGWSGMWIPVVPGLVSSHRLLVPDLPGLGASTVAGGPPSTDLVLAWLAELVERTCTSAPALVGMSLGGSIAARFSARHRDRLRSLVLMDAGGLAGRVRPRPGVLAALLRQTSRPSEQSSIGLLRRLTVDLDPVRERMGAQWGPFVGYMTDLARMPSVREANRQLLRQLGLPAIPRADLEAIDVRTSLIWGRHDPVVRLPAVEKVAARYRWPLRVIDGAGHLPQLEQPAAVLDVLRASIAPRE